MARGVTLIDIAKRFPGLCYNADEWKEWYNRARVSQYTTDDKDYWHCIRDAEFDGTNIILKGCRRKYSRKEFKFGDLFRMMLDHPDAQLIGAYGKPIVSFTFADHDEGGDYMPSHKWFELADEDGKIISDYYTTIEE